MIKHALLANQSIGIAIHTPSAPRPKTVARMYALIMRNTAMEAIETTMAKRASPAALNAVGMLNENGQMIRQPIVWHIVIFVASAAVSAERLYSDRIGLRHARIVRLNTHSEMYDIVIRRRM